MAGNRSQKSRGLLQFRLEEVVHIFIHSNGEEDSSNPKESGKNK